MDTFFFVRTIFLKSIKPVSTYKINSADVKFVFDFLFKTFWFGGIMECRKILQLFPCLFLLLKLLHEAK